MSADDVNLAYKELGDCSRKTFGMLPPSRERFETTDGSRPRSVSLLSRVRRSSRYCDIGNDRLRLAIQSQRAQRYVR
jgi:hypothetical protein